MKRGLMPPDAGCIQPCDLRQGAARGRDHEHVTRFIVFAARKTVWFRCAGVPGAGVDLFGAMPVAQRDVVKTSVRQTSQVQLIYAAGGFFIVAVSAESLDAAVGQDDARLVTRNVERLQP